MSLIAVLKEKVVGGEEITKDEAICLYESDLDELTKAADDIRKHFCGNTFDICTIINAKSGRCSEDCKYCAQSVYHNTNCDEYPLLSVDDIVRDAKKQYDAGVLRFSLVTSGRSLSDVEVEEVCSVVEKLKAEVPIRTCGSFGLLNALQYEKLRESGLTRVHNNLETSKENFINMCSTHSFTDKITSIKAAKEKGMAVCSGGIFGIGESTEDRISLAFSLRELSISSVPINILNPIKGTPYEGRIPLTSDEICRVIAVYRFVLPTAFIRLAGGRGLLADKGRSCFTSGANAAISGDMLTTSGITVEIDLAMIKELGFEVKLIDE